MKVGRGEAKTHLSKLVELARRGERIAITRRGRPAAVLVPVAEPAELTEMEAVTQLMEMRKGLSLGGLTPVELRDMGRRR
ncbi:MAG: type II toxin-antitoxin system prevent-host-death family antitoxin [Acidobacteria bacterium]|nr:type II toxin-antitoxin system prevent-host-death family antitoxin [Acidobacteriota bacterium]